MEWSSDAELFGLIRVQLNTPAVGDILDRLGRHHQFLPASIQPLREGMLVAGWAMPVLVADVHGPQKKPFGLMTEALDDLRPGEVYVAAGGSGRCAYWGELLTATAIKRGAAGAVLDGFHRDTPKVLAQNWPVFSRGRYAQDSSIRAAVLDFRCAIEVGGVSIVPGDLVFGDLDGVVVVPRDCVGKVIAGALKKVRGEGRVRRAIEAGMTSTQAFKKFGIL